MVARSPDPNAWKSKQPGNEPVGKAVAILGAGFSLAASALAGMFLGSFLDRSREGRFFTAFGFLLGLFAGFYRAYTLIKSMLGKRGPE